MGDEILLSIVFPCLNEEATVGRCAAEARAFLEEKGIPGEVLVVDNGCRDKSAAAARKAKAKVVCEDRQGYGAAILRGIKEAAGRYVIMLDSDGSYDIEDFDVILKRLEEGYELVMGNRFAGKIEKGAMPWLHRYIGNPLLSALGRWVFKSKIHDFHCGIRGFDRERMLSLDLSSPGFEFATEMVAKSEGAGLRITEVPVNLKRDGRKGGSHIRPIKDGIRHLAVMLFLKPKSHDQKTT